MPFVFENIAEELPSQRFELEPERFVFEDTKPERFVFEEEQPSVGERLFTGDDRAFLPTGEVQTQEERRQLASDFSTQAMELGGETLKRTAEVPIGLGEAIGTLGQAVVAMPVAGLKVAEDLYNQLTKRVARGESIDWEQSREILRRTQEELMPFQPETEFGRTVTEVVASPFMAGVEGLKVLSEAVTDDPQKQAAIQVIGETAAILGIPARTAFKKSKVLTEKEVARIEKPDIPISEDTTIELHAGLPLNKIISGERKSAWQEFWRPFSTMPKSEEALFERSRQFGDIGKAERIVGQFHDKLKSFTPEAKQDIFRFLDGQIELIDLPEGARKTARSIQQRQITIGKMLVKRDIISESQFEANKGEYVHYMFAKHVLGDRATVGLGATGKLNRSYTIARNPDMTMEQRRAIGLIEDASIAVPVGMGKALTDIAKFDYMERVSQEPSWVWTPSLVNVAGQKMGIGKLIEEVDAMKRVVEQFPENLDAQNRFATLSEALNEAKIATANVPKEFVQLPTTKTFGPLAGAYVRKSIADDTLPLISSTIGANKGKLFNSLVQIETQGMALFKASKVALNFPTAFRNVISNFMQNNMRGRSLHEIPGDLVNAVKSMKAKDQNFTLAKRHGLFRTNWAITEINEILGEFQKVQPSNWGSFMGAVQKLAKYYGNIDDVAKHTIFVQMQKAGAPLEVSLLEAQKWGMDYSLASRSIKELRRHIIPFASYQYKIAPLIAESLQVKDRGYGLKTSPLTIGKFMAVPYIAAKAVQGLNDMSNEEWDKMKKDLPLYMKRNETHMVLPWKDPDGRWQWVNLEYYFPWGNWHQIFKDMKDQEFGELAKDTGVLSNPFLDLASAIKSGRGGEPPLDPFTGVPIYGKLDSPQDQWLSIAEFLYNKWAPGMITRYGAAGYTESIGEKDKWGRTITPGQAVGRWFGFNIVSVSPKQTKVIKRAMIRDLKKELFRIRTDPSATKEEIQAAKERFKEQRKKILQGEP